MSRAAYCLSLCLVLALQRRREEANACHSHTPLLLLHPLSLTLPLFPPHNNTQQSSGFGVKGSVGRCYPIWSAFEKCLVSVCLPAVSGARERAVLSFLSVLINGFPLTCLIFFPHPYDHDYQATAPHFKECMDFRDDYVECLHHRKEVCVLAFLCSLSRRVFLASSCTCDFMPFLS